MSRKYINYELQHTIMVLLVAEKYQKATIWESEHNNNQVSGHSVCPGLNN